MTEDQLDLRLMIREELVALAPLLVRELAKLLPRAAPPPSLYMSVLVCARRYGRSPAFIRTLCRTGELRAVFRKNGRRGMGEGQYLVLSEAAEQHPDLGAGLAGAP